MWTLKSEGRRLNWKKFRERIDSMPLDQALQETAHLWSYAPYVAYCLDPDKPRSWPDPWTLLHENYYCDIAKALGMLYTLYLTDHNKLSFELRLYYSPEEKADYNVVWINDGEYVLNLDFNNVVNKHKAEGLVLRQRYTEDDLRLHDIK